MSHLEICDSVKLLRLCQAWSGPAAEALYQTPPLKRADDFPRLTALLNSKTTTHPYSLLVREFIFRGNDFYLLFDSFYNHYYINILY